MKYNPKYREFVKRSIARKNNNKLGRTYGKRWEK
jgi:hypothetical protein